MTMEEARKVVATLMVTYPNYNPVDEELAAKTWVDVAGDFTYSQISKGLNLYMRMSASGFAPTPGQVINTLYNASKPPQLNEMEAWSLVSKAIRNSGYNSEKEFAKLPPLVQKAVGLPRQLRTWALDESYNESVVMSGFMKVYKETVLQNKERSKIPREIRAAIEKENGSQYLAQIEQERRKTIESASHEKQGKITATEAVAEGGGMPDRLKPRYQELFGEESECELG